MARQLHLHLYISGEGRKPHYVVYAAWKNRSALRAARGNAKEEDAPGAAAAKRRAKQMLREQQQLSRCSGSSRSEAAAKRWLGWKDALAVEVSVKTIKATIYGHGNGNGHGNCNGHGNGRLFGSV